MTSKFTWAIGLLLSGAMAIAQPVLNDLPNNTGALTRDQSYLLAAAFHAASNFYVEPITQQKAVENAIKGVLSNLDPHSAYLNKKDFEDLKVGSEGEFTGVGLEVTRESHGAIAVVAPIDGTPAARAGIQSGDIIIDIDGVSVKGMTLNEAVSRMRGKRGKEVTLTLLRKDRVEPFRVLLKRESVSLHSVRSELLEGQFGYIRIGFFQKDTHEELLKAIADLEKESRGQLKGIVLDLRNDPGGLLDASVAVADVFLDANRLEHNAEIVSTRGRAFKEPFIGRATEGERLTGVPIVALVNQGTASAAEIVAGALQDHKRAVIMGVNTFGKGSVQTLLPLEEGRLGAIKITTARYYTPSGRSIQAEGIAPDVVVENLHVPTTVKARERYALREEGLMNHHEAVLEKDASEQVQSDQEKTRALIAQIRDTSERAEEKALIYRDYQLHQALLLLKGLQATIK